MRQAKTSRHAGGRTRRALVLITVLWVVVLLAVIVAMTVKATRLDARVGVAMGEQVRGRWACRAGLEKAIAILSEDSTASDCLTDLWSDNPEELLGIAVQRASCNVRIIDEASKLNINTATKEQLMALANMTKEIAASIIDWRDENDEPEASGAEVEYYSNLPLGYRPRNGDFHTIRELLLVKDVTAELLYGEDTNLNGQLDINEDDSDATLPLDDADGVLDEGWIVYLTCYSYDRNVDAAGTARVNVNEADENKLKQDLGLSAENAKWIVENRRENKYTTIAALLGDGQNNSNGNKDKGKPLTVDAFKNIADRVTISSDQSIPGRVNVNTASREVLIALLGGEEKIADAIITHRDGLTEGMVSIGELLDIKSMTKDKFKEIAEKVTTRSNVFSVDARARNARTGGEYRAEAVIDRGATVSKIVYLYQGAYH